MPREGGALTVVLVYPGLLGTYGDRGNAAALAWRGRWLGVEVDLLVVAPGEPVPRLGDIYLLGGAEDEAQVAAVDLLRADGGLHDAVARGAQLLAVCAGYQVLGESFPAGGRQQAGLGLLDVRTVRSDEPRAVGELVAVPASGLEDLDRLPVLTGYENHAGRTELGAAARPLARVASGVGNGDGSEGAVMGTVLATYLHGPVLARNPALADLLLGRAVGRPLAAAGPEEFDTLRAERLKAARYRGRAS